jgi:tripartite-type tricarboxylate transporter receptor subunit TctC
MAKARADKYPSRPVRFVVPFPPGSITDVVSRVLARELQPRMNQPILVDNKPGGQTTIGTAAVARSDPDGYTLLVGAISFVGAINEIRDLPYHPSRDFTPIALLGTFPIVLVVRPDFPARTPAEFLTHLRTHKKNWSGGYGSSSSRLALVQLQQQDGVDIQDVAYKGIPLAVNDLLAGVIDFTFADLAGALAQVKAGNLRAIGVTSPKPSIHAPDWPSLVDEIPSLDMSAWLAVLGPKGIPKDVASMLHREIMDVMSQPSTQKALETTAMTPSELTLEQMQGFIDSEVDKWARLYKAAGIEPN